MVPLRVCDGTVSSEQRSVNVSSAAQPRRQTAGLASAAAADVVKLRREISRVICHPSQNNAAAASGFATADELLGRNLFAPNGATSDRASTPSTSKYAQVRPSTSKTPKDAAARSAERRTAGRTLRRAWRYTESTGDFLTRSEDVRSHQRAKTFAPGVTAARITVTRGLPFGCRSRRF